MMFIQQQDERVKKFAFILSALFSLTACEDNAIFASKNISRASDRFEIMQRVMFYNGITDNYILAIEGYCSVELNSNSKEFNVICKTSDGFKRHTLVLSDNVTAFVEQIDAKQGHYRVTFKPSVIVPDIDIR